ncbi:MAG TPA: DUF1292 domain-containing protein [Acholeplasma sp.]|jgi:uncharacterized protein YrzB (UPF0473 family)|nr:DUF1292 domain-containing protein [Acholeplasma sp.]
MEENQIIITMEDGSEEVAEILFTHYSEETKKNYVVFEFLNSGEISAAIYEASKDNTEEGAFSDIETEAEWDMMDELLEAYFDEMEDAPEEEEN